MTNIFVYGTLKKGYWNHKLIEEGNSEFLGELVITGFKLFESGIPFMKRTSNPDDKVLGEIYAVNERTLERMDRLEGHPHSYRREPVSFGDDDNLETYIYQRDLDRTHESPKINGVYVYGRSPINYGREKQV